MTARALAVPLLLLASIGAVSCAGTRRDRMRENEALTPQAAYANATAELSQRNLRKARQMLEKIRFGASDRDLEPLVKLALADATFYQGDDLSLIEARSKFLDFVTFYGDHPMAAYAQFQAGVCSLRQVEDPTMDQTQTRIAIEDLSEVERRYPASVYAAAARDKISQARGNLAEHEYLVGRFYLRRKEYLAAAERLRSLLDRYPTYPEKDKVYFYLGAALVRGQSDAEGRIYLEKLVSDFPDTPYLQDARELLASVEVKADGDGSPR